MPSNGVDTSSSLLLVPIRTINDVDPDGKSTSLPHLKGLRDGDLARSKVKQVASGRFGVTPASRARGKGDVPGACSGNSVGVLEVACCV